MSPDRAAELRARVSGVRAHRDVTALAAFHRVQSSPGYREAAAWLVESLRRAGLEPEVEEVPGDGRTRYQGWLMPEGWECTLGRATLHGAAGAGPLCDYSAARLSLVLRSAPAAGRFPLVALDDVEGRALPEPGDVRGKLVLGEGAPHALHQRWVVERGAAGILCDGRRVFPPVRDRGHDPEALHYTSFWWDEQTPRGFGLVVSPGRGVELRRRMARGEPLEVELEIRSRFYEERIPLVSAALPGAGPEEVLVVAHLCHPQPSANDNASGAAAALECARALAASGANGARAVPPRGVRFLWVPEFTGTAAWLCRDPGRARCVVAGLNLDMVGEDQQQTGSTLLLERPPLLAASFAELVLARARDASLDWVASYSGPGHFSLTRTAEVPFAGGSDHALLCDPQVGAPCPMLIQWPDRYYHSSLDTPDRCHPESLALAARTAALYAATLAASTASEATALLDEADREARIRALQACSAAEPRARVAAEALRGRRALASFARLGVPGPEIKRRIAALDEFIARETPGTAAPARGGRRNHRVPRRRLGLTLPYPRHLIPGWPGLPCEQREEWQRTMDAASDAYLSCDLAWYACDGRRSVDEILALVELETGRDDRRLVERFFDLTASLGASDWTGEK